MVRQDVNNDMRLNRFTQSKMNPKTGKRDKNVIFVSSNASTGKTTKYKWTKIRAAYEKGKTFDVFFRMRTGKNGIEGKFTNTWLTPPPNASKRLLKLLAECKPYIKGDYLFSGEGKKLAKAIELRSVEASKSVENELLTSSGLFDEYIPETADGKYVKDETLKLARIMKSRSRNRNYHIIGCANNTNPNNLYKRDYVNNSKVKFVDVVLHEYANSVDEEKTDVDEFLEQTPWGKLNAQNKPKMPNYLQKGCIKGRRVCQLVVEGSETNDEKMYALYTDNDYYYIKRIKKLKLECDTYRDKSQRADYFRMIYPLYISHNKFQVLCNDIHSMQFINDLKYVMNEQF